MHICHTMAPSQSLCKQMYRINHFLLLFVLFVYIIFSIQIFTINAKKKKSNSKKPSKVTGKCKTTKNKCINTTKGKYVWSTGDFYKGQFNVNGVMEGKGLIRWKKTKDVLDISYLLLVLRDFVVVLSSTS